MRRVKIKGVKELNEKELEESIKEKPSPCLKPKTKYYVKAVGRE